MRVLIACEFSGIVREAFRKRGHDAWSCDYLDTEIPGNHIKGNVISVLNDGWDMMIAHPPCTYLSKAGTRQLYVKGEVVQSRWIKGIEAVLFFNKLLNAKIPKVCIENPIPFKIYNLPPWQQIVDPYEFGTPFKKRTCLWLKNLPPLQSSVIALPAIPTYTPNCWFQKNAGGKSKNRSRTFPEIATAMALQWG